MLKQDNICKANNAVSDILYGKHFIAITVSINITATSRKYLSAYYLLW